MKLRLIWIIHTLVIGSLLCFAFSPIVGLIVVGEIADANDCEVNESGPQPCIVNGKDIGPELYTWGVMGWMMFLTIPFGLGGIAIYLLILLVIWLIRWMSRKSSASSPMISLHKKMFRNYLFRLRKTR